MTMTGTHCFTRTDQAEWQAGADGRITVKDTAANWFFPLNHVASLIWDMTDGTNSVNDIVAAVCAEFDIDENTARSDVEEFLEQAQDLNLVE